MSLIDVWTGQIRFIHSGLDDVAIEVKDALQSADKVVLRCEVRGTNTREWMGRPPTGRSFAAEQIQIYRLEGGQIADNHAAAIDLNNSLRLQPREVAGNQFTHGADLRGQFLIANAQRDF